MSIAISQPDDIEELSKNLIIHRKIVSERVFITDK